jgi:tryptophanyl-tRNA synthetase
MAADILLYDANIVPVGKDQQQHLEITRDIAKSFNFTCGETFVVPEAQIQKEVMIVPGVDGQKMSKSYGNTIDIFVSDKELLQTIKTIQTDSTPLEAPKNPDTCNVFNIFKLVANPEQVAELRTKYLAGGFGYGHAKQALFEVIVDTFRNEREAYSKLMENPMEVEEQLQIGKVKAKKVALQVLGRVREKLGY